MILSVDNHKAKAKVKETKMGQLREHQEEQRFIPCPDHPTTDARLLFPSSVFENPNT